MNVVERRARKLKKQIEYMARMKAADELNRKKAGVLPKEETPVVAPQEEEISYSVQSIEAAIVPSKNVSEDAELGEADMFVKVVVNEENPAAVIGFDITLSGPVVAATEETILVEAPTEPTEAPEAAEEEDEPAKPEEVTSDLLDEPVVQPKKRGKKKKS